MNGHNRGRARGRLGALGISVRRAGHRAQGEHRLGAVLGKWYAGLMSVNKGQGTGARLPALLPALLPAGQPMWVCQCGMRHHYHVSQCRRCKRIPRNRQSVETRADRIAHERSLSYRKDRDTELSLYRQLEREQGTPE
jgi:hypothetical protein